MAQAQASAETAEASRRAGTRKTNSAMPVQNRAKSRALAKARPAKDRTNVAKQRIGREAKRTCVAIKD